MKIYGLTGGVACGKSTVSRMARALGISIWDADAVTHSLYRNDTTTKAFVSLVFPEAFDFRDIKVDRRILGEIVFRDDTRRHGLEHFMTERLEAHLDHFLHDNAGHHDVMLDVPLLFECRLDTRCDEVIVVHCPPEVQRARCLARGWSEERIDKIISLQWSDEQRFPLAQHLIDTSRDVVDVERALGYIVNRANDGPVTIQ